MRKTVLTYLAAGAMAFTTACGTDDPVEMATERSLRNLEATGIKGLEKDARFVAEAASANNLQIDLAETVMERGVNSEVKEFAENMESEHRRKLNDLRVIAGQTQLEVPERLGLDHHDVYKNIVNKEGNELDGAYIRAVVDQHKELLKKYGDIAENGLSVEVKEYASKEIPVIRQHLNQAEQLKGVVDKK